MLDEYFARIRAHRNNIHRYRRLLKSNLSDVERQFIEKRLTEEQTALESLSAETFPLAFGLRKGGGHAGELGAEPRTTCASGTPGGLIC
ncbi:MULTISPECIES: DUF4349 domain-containing protein [Bradyrhizobium]|jgi:hypothetical protein|uniref:DUF4349 domain-containing protein n=1 Tax=Bradyrhizobium TaxID=374 RepID=UPI001F253F97|nr:MULTISPECIES: DUF4349 domain-containing protein [Bradyrhizobium]